MQFPAESHRLGPVVGSLYKIISFYIQQDDESIKIKYHENERNIFTTPIVIEANTRVSEKKKTNMKMINVSNYNLKICPLHCKADRKITKVWISFGGTNS